MSVPPQLKVLPTLARRRAPLASAQAQLELLDGLKLAGVAAEDSGAPPSGDFDRHLARSGQSPLRASTLDVFQINVGRICNQTCVHCHVDAGPDRQEVMTHETASLAMRVLATTSIPTVDITGGAPEMCPEFRYLVEESRRLGRHVMDRCNLTILNTAPHADLPEFLAKHQVEIVCSLPHYRGPSTDRQRGDGVFESSIEALRKLNAVGYGRRKELRLVLVTNPVGAFLPAGQASLEAE